MWKSALIGLSVAGAFATSAAADVAATAITDLNVRAGPGPEFAVTGLIPANSAVSVTGCIQGSKWCTVSTPGGAGWAYSDYLTTQYSGNPVVLAQAPPAVALPPAVYNGPAPVAPGYVASASLGTLGPPVIVGAAPVPPAPVQPPPSVQTYVTTNPVTPVYLNGEVVVGASLPPTVTVAPVPQYQYQYGYVNGVPVLVDPTTRQIVYIFR